VILSVSVRVIPKPERNMTLTFDASQTEALAYLQELRKTNLPITATACLDDQVSIRLSASDQVLQACKTKVKGDELIASSGDSNESDTFWQSIRDHSHAFFNNDRPLWRFSLPPASADVIPLDDSQLLEWGGAQRWIHSNTPANIIRDIAKSHNGHATLFARNHATELDIFPTLEPALFALHQRLKNQMDPQRIFNPNRIYRGL
jgi:glycolate oxidase FAD binding subunit